MTQAPSSNISAIASFCLFHPHAQFIYYFYLLDESEQEYIYDILFHLDEEHTLKH